MSNRPAFAAAALLAALIVSASTARAEPRADATLVVDRLVSQAVMEATFDAMEQLTRQALTHALSQDEAASLTPAGRDVVITRFLDEMRRSFLPLMRDELIQVYMAELTPAELAGLRTFLETPAGAAFSQKQAALTRRSSQVGGRVGETIGINAGKSIAAWLKTDGGNVIANANDLAILRRIFPAP